MDVVGGGGPPLVDVENISQVLLLFAGFRIYTDIWNIIRRSISSNIDEFFN